MTTELFFLIAERITSLDLSALVVLVILSLGCLSLKLDVKPDKT